MSYLSIQLDDPGRADVIDLLAAHARHAEASTPPGYCHYLDAGDLKAPDIRFWTARDAEGALLGCIALRDLGGGQAELKSMHTAEAARGQGVGAALVRHLIAEARAAGFERVDLETAKTDGFAASRRLYAREGFVERGPFAQYTTTKISHFMGLAL